MYEQSLAVCRSSGDTLGLIIALDNLGIIATHAAEYAKARQLLAEALTLSRELEAVNSLMQVLTNSALLEVAEGRYDTASAMLREALLLAKPLTYYQVIAKCLDGVATIGAASGRPLEAGRLWGAADAARAAAHKRRNPNSEADYQQRVAAARAAGGAAAFDNAWVAGGAMPTDKAVDYGLSLLPE